MINSALRWSVAALVLLTGCTTDDDNPECTRTIESSITVVVENAGYVCLYADQTAELRVLPRPEATYLWSSGDSTASIEVDQPGIYSVSVSDTNGSVDSFLIQLYDCNPPDLVAIPSSFTPNGDGINDIWFPVIAESCGINVQVRDLDGNRMFETSDFTEAWNGENIFENLPAPMGTYFYTVNVTYFNGTTSDYTGEVLLIR